MAKFEYEIQQSGPKKNIVVYKDGSKIFSGAPTMSADDGKLKSEAITTLKDTYSDISSMSLKKQEKEEPALENNTSGKGESVESTPVISKEARDKIQKTQEATKKELKDANSKSSVSMSSELSKSKLSDLKVPMLGVPKDMSLKQISMKDMINTSKVNLATDDLSKLKRTDLNLKMLFAIGFSAFTIIMIVILILRRIKAISKKAKRKRKMLIATSTNKPYIRSLDNEQDTEDDLEVEKELDRLEEERINELTLTIETDKNTLLGLETKLSDSTYLNLTAPETIISEEETVESLKTKITEEEQELSELKSAVITNTPTNISGNDTSSYNKLDQYSKKRNNLSRKVNNSPYTVDQRNRNDVMDSSKAVSTKKVSTLYKNNPNYGKYFNTFNI